MPKNTHLANFEKGQIIGMHNTGVTLTSIAEEINRDHSTVSKFLIRVRERRSIEVALRSGRPSIFTNEDEQNLINAKWKKKLNSMGMLHRREKGPLAFMRERNGGGAINSQRYVEVLNENLIPFRHELIANYGNDIIFQDDNALIHQSKYTRDWMESENI
ncbi:2812_t:CDS:2 [Racocetra fulgida]|uniref:2812_t:CDS:1 n=1 Tax=Racocetra fulgida TaxID=60492 RepID=A0A9N9N9L7_9GLOM|nr:2812_t:CDS:2 [Racocetra fulgida]